MKFRKLYLAIICLGAISALFLTYQRMGIESAYKTYELTMSFEELRKISELSGRSIEEELRLWKDAGLNSVTMEEENITSLKTNRSFRLSTKHQGSDLFIEATREGIDFIEKGLKETYTENRKIERISDTELLVEGKESDFTYSKKEGATYKVEKMGLGYIQSDIEMIKDAGLGIRFRPVFIQGEQDLKKTVDRFLDYVERYSKQSYVVFKGNESFASDGKFDYVKEKFKEHRISIGMIENIEQRKHIEQVGLEDLVEAMDFDAIRVFSTWDFIQSRYDYGIRGHHHGEEIMNSYFRAITERNVRVIYVKPFLENKITPVTDMEIYKARFGELKARLEAFPHRIRNIGEAEGRIEVMPASYDRPLRQLFVAIAAIASGLVVLDNLLTIRKSYMNFLLGLGILVSTAIYLLKIKLGSFNGLFGFASIVVYVCLASQLVIIASKRIFEEGSSLSRPALFAKSLSLLLFAILISLLGAISEVAFYLPSKYLLELSFFRGVKLSQLLPIMLVFFMGLFYFAKIILKKENMSNLEIAKGIMDLNVKVWHAMLAGIVLMGMAVLLIRSGNSDVEPSKLELLMRNILENTLPARPRTKAFIVGYPSVVLLFYFAGQKRYRIFYPLLVIFVAVGQANILNTFSHFRTPLYMSFMRVCFEFLLAAVLSALYLLVIEAIRKLLRRMMARS